MHRQPRSIESIVDYQIKRWEANRLQREARQKETAAHRPVITISRQYGTGGTSLARELSERMHFNCWDQELVHDIAEHSAAPERLFASLDEHRQHTVQALINATLYPGRPNAAQYLTELRRTVHTVADHGAAVIVGRGAHCILRSDEALKVRIVSPVEKRVAWVMAESEASLAQAQAKVEEVDADRAAFLRDAFRHELTNIDAFDIVINMEHLTIDQAADVIMAAYAARFDAD